MNCPKYPPMLSRLLDQELSPRETAEVESHLVQCADCRALMKSWRLQGEHLRHHLHRHSLGEDFVAKVSRNAQARRDTAAVDSPAPSPSWGRMRWLQIAAAVIVAAAVISLYFSGRNTVGYARVVEPGALEVLQSSAWVPATAGELLRPGDWLRNSVGGAPEIMLRDACRLTLEAGTLAHIPDGETSTSDKVVLMNGSLASEIPSGGGDFQVQTPAGAVTATRGSLTVRVADFALPQLTIEADQSETLTGTMVPVGEVHVTNGTARIQIDEEAREVRAGMSARFSRSDFTDASERPAAIAASLRIVTGVSEPGTISTALTASSDNLWIDLEVANVSVKKLLEWAAAAEVRGGDGMRVAGNLRFPTSAGSEAIASAVGAALGLPISYRMEKAQHTLAFGSLKPTPASGRSHGTFTFEKSPDGTISFDFQSVPAGQVFRILRSSVSDLPALAAEAVDIPISIQAAALHPAEAASWIGKTLELHFKQAEGQAGIVEVGPAPAAAPPADPQAPVRQQPREPRTVPIRATGLEGGSVKSDGGMPAAAAAEASSTGQSHYDALPEDSNTRSLWSILGRNAESAASFAISGKSSTDASDVRGKATPKKRQFFGIDSLLPDPAPTTHLIWPALDAESAAGVESSYIVVNNTQLPAHLLWNGYDREGTLVAQYAVFMDGASALALLPVRDLPSSLGEGGHWETLSNLPLAGSRDAETSQGLAAPVSAEQMTSQWEFPSAWLGLGARVWFANPMQSEATVVVSVMRRGREIASEMLQIPPHGGATWPGIASSFSSGMTVTVRVLRGSIASGLR
jgi:hypothetical protein